MWWNLRYLIIRRWQAFVRWVAWRLPHELVGWAYARVVAHATTGEYRNTVVPELAAMEAWKRWDDNR